MLLSSKQGEQKKLYKEGGENLLSNVIIHLEKKPRGKRLFKQ